MRSIGRITVVASVGCFTFGLTMSALGQTVQDPVKFDVSPALRTIQPPARAQGAFFREDAVKNISLPPENQSGIAYAVLQKKATTRRAIGPIKPFAGIGRENY